MEMIALKNTGVLDFVGCVRIHDVSTTFVAVDNFVNNTDHNSKIKFGHSFEGFFGNQFLFRQGGKFENVAAQTVLCCYKLLMEKYCPTSSDIFSAIGDEAYAETALADIYALLLKQPNGEDGILLSEPHALNLFFVRDIIGGLRVIIVQWLRVSWHIGADEINKERGYAAGHRLFLRHYMVEEPASARSR